MPDRSHYLPRASVLEKLSNSDRHALLEHHCLWLRRDIDHLRAGDVLITDHHSVSYHLGLMRARMRRLKKLAQSFGHQLNDDVDEKAA